MEIYLNGKAKDIPGDLNVSCLLKLIESDNWVAVFINKVPILQSEYSTVYLKEKDDVKIIRPLAGG